MSELFCFTIEGPQKTFVGYADNQNFEKICEYLHYMSQGWLENNQEVIQNMGMVALPNYLYLFFSNFTGETKNLRLLPHSTFKDKEEADEFTRGILREQARYVYRAQVKKIDKSI